MPDFRCGNPAVDTLLMRPGLPQNLNVLVIQVPLISHPERHKPEVGTVGIKVRWVEEAF